MNRRDRLIAVTYHRSKGAADYGSVRSRLVATMLRLLPGKSLLWSTRDPVDGTRVRKACDNLSYKTSKRFGYKTVDGGYLITRTR